MDTWIFPRRLAWGLNLTRTQWPTKLDTTGAIRSLTTLTTARWSTGKVLWQFVRAHLHGCAGARSTVAYKISQLDSATGDDAAREAPLLSYPLGASALHSPHRLTPRSHHGCSHAGRGQRPAPPCTATYSQYLSPDPQARKSATRSGGAKRAPTRLQTAGVR